MLRKEDGGVGVENWGDGEEDAGRSWESTRDERFEAE